MSRVCKKSITTKTRVIFSTKNAVDTALWRIRIQIPFIMLIFGNSSISSTVLTSEIPSISSIVSGITICDNIIIPMPSGVNISIIQRIKLNEFALIQLIVIRHNFIHFSFKLQLPKTISFQTNFSGIEMPNNLSFKSRLIGFIKDRIRKAKNQRSSLSNNFGSVIISNTLSMPSKTFTNKPYFCRIFAHTFCTTC